MKKLVLAAAAYIVIVFPLAMIWHIGLFHDQYQAFGYFSGSPNITLGFLTIVLQGAVLAVMFPRFQTGRFGVVRALQFAGLVGLFFWTSHVLALVAKQNVPDAVGFIVMETGYLMAQFGLYACALAWIYKRR